MPLALSCDVTDRRQVHEILHQRLTASPPIRGVFHAAMVMDDASVLNLDDGRVQAVLGPKAMGAWNLHEETRGFPIDHFVLFSSISASIGNPGQASYAAANSILEGLAEYRRSIGLPATAVGWGFVSDIGFAAQHVELMKRAEEHGFHGVRSSDYLDMLERLMPRDCETVVVGKFDWEAVAGSFHKARPASGLSASLVGEFSNRRFRLSRRFTDSERPGECDGRATERFAARLFAGPGRAHPARCAEKVDVERPIVDLGLDSLMGVKPATVVEQDCAYHPAIVGDLARSHRESSGTGYPAAHGLHKPS